ncbi:Uncharacterised protein [Halioglobus japonicus]|nr:Uncharacterised protein [Halioglobus japonicus]
MKNWRVTICALLAMGSTMSHAIEEPSWTLVTELDNVEIRQYESVIQARTPIGESDKATGGFRTLANYIFGGNAQEQEIAMTAPVEERLGDDDAYMAFTMPSQYSLEELPAPSGELVTLHEVPARTMAVVSFSGWARDGVVEEQTQILLDTIESHGWVVVSSPFLNQYNPPWTLWGRRNEVMVEVEKNLSSTGSM